MALLWKQTCNIRHPMHLFHHVRSSKWLIFMCDTAHACVTNPIHTCDVTDSFVWHILLISHAYVRRYSFMCNITHAYVRRDWFICVTYLYLEVMHTCNATNSSVTEPMHTCDVTDSVAVHYLLVLNIDIVRGARCIKARRITRGGILRDIHWERESACARMWVRG